MTAPASEAAKSVKATGTEYVVLKRTKEAAPGGTATGVSSNPPPVQYEAWTRLPGSYFGSPEQVIRKAAHKGEDQYDAGTYIAIPARSFKPVSLTTRVETKVKLG
jgi:hypothetical protein